MNGAYTRRTSALSRDSRARPPAVSAMHLIVARLPAPVRVTASPHPTPPAARGQPAAPGAYGPRRHLP